MTIKWQPILIILFVIVLLILWTQHHEVIQTMGNTLKNIDSSDPKERNYSLAILCIVIITFLGVLRIVTRK